MQTEMRKDNTYDLLILLISIGAVIAAFRDMIPETGAWILLAALPLMWVIKMATHINRALIPRTLMRGSYGTWFFAMFMICLGIPLLGIAMEWGIRRYFQYPDRITDYTSPWILADSLSTCALLMAIMFGMALGEYYMRWRSEMRKEQRIGRELDERLVRFKDRIKPEELLNKLDNIISACHENASLAAEELRSLSAELRERLYNNEEPDRHADISLPEMSLMESFVSKRKYSWLRIVVLELFLAVTSLTSLFTSPDSPEFSAESWLAFAGMDIVFNVLVFGNVILTNYFIKRGQLIKYLISGGIFIMVMGIVTIITQFFTYEPSITGAGTMGVYAILSMLATLAAITLVLGGVTAFLALQNWLKERKHITELKMETTRVELSLLQSQINPHFLFNVLNNIGILLYESTEEAEKMLLELRSLLCYQLIDAEREYTTAAEEASFINSYLALEKSRKEPFDYKIECKGDMGNVKLPTLLLIPFVENASKHSVAIDGKRDLIVKMQREGSRFIFSCINPFNPAKRDDKNRVGGLGIRNTLRRLQLLFDDKYVYEQRITGCKYEVRLTIPIK